MLDTAAFGAELCRRGFDFFSGVPCSYLKNLINFAINECDYVAAVNEGDAVAIATGAFLGGRKAVVLMQNSGLTNAVSPLTSLNPIFRLPVLGFVSLRGAPGEKDEPQHRLMGEVTDAMLDTMGIAWEYLSSDQGEAARQLDLADISIRDGRSFFFVVRKDIFSAVKLSLQVPLSSRNMCKENYARQPEGMPTRRNVLKAIVNSTSSETILIASTGFTGRELYEIGDEARNFYMVGSMGCASSLGLGLALAQPGRPVAVIDGDGAALMRMGAFATNGYYAPSNLLHILLDNGCHESTGGQATVSPNVDWPLLASACGYPVSLRLAGLAELADSIRSWLESPRLTFFTVGIRCGVPDSLSRPTVTPEEVAVRLMKFLGPTT